MEDFKKVNFAFEALDLCPVCLSKIFIPDGRINWLGVSFWYVVCPQCGLKFMNPRPTLESYRDFYKNLFWQQKIRNLGFHQASQAWQAGKYKWDNEEEWSPEFGRKNLMEKTSALRIETITKVLAGNLRLGKNTNILEVGCSYPVTLQSLKSNFACNVFAIEPSDEAIEVIKQNEDIKLLGRYAEDLLEIAKADSKFDAIIFSHVLENTTDPVKVIGLAKACLNPGGLIYIQTPNLLVNDQMNPYHPFIFSSNVLELIAEKNGLEYKKISKTIDRMLTAVLLNKR